MRWLVMGSGATGGYFGGRLARAGLDVTFVARGAHLAALNVHGLQVRSTAGDFTLPVVATNDPATAGPVDVVLFAVKSYDTEQAAGAIAPVLGKRTAILCVQNGVENEDRLAALHGAARVLGAATRIEATVPEPGVIAHMSPFARLAFGAWSGVAGDRERAILADLTGAGIEATLGDDARRIVWEKFLFLCPVAAVTSVTRASIGDLLAHEETRTMLRDAVAEVAAVAATQGVQLGGEAAVAASMAMLAGLPPAMRSSMQRDHEAGRRIELDALSGAVVRLGRAAGVPTPVHRIIHAALTPAALAAERAAATPRA